MGACSFTSASNDKNELCSQRLRANQEVNQSLMSFAFRHSVEIKRLIKLPNAAP